jgi:hypothetical protein
MSGNIGGLCWGWGREIWIIDRRAISGGPIDVYLFVIAIIGKKVGKRGRVAEEKESKRRRGGEF